MLRLLILLCLLISASVWAQGNRASVFSLEKVTLESMLYEEIQEHVGSQEVQGVFHGMGAAGDSMIAYKLDGRWELFSAYIGYLKSAPKTRKATFEVLLDGVSVYVSPVMAGEQEPEFIKIPVKDRQILMLRIHPQSYGSTQGAAYGTPMVYSGVKPEDLDQSFQVNINGKRATVPMMGGKAPRELPVPIPLTGASAEYRVKVIQEAGKNRVQITTEKVSP